MRLAITTPRALDAHMRCASYVDGHAPTQADVSVFRAIQRPDSSLPHALRWYCHMRSFSEHRLALLPGAVEDLIPTSSPRISDADQKWEPKSNPDTSSVNRKMRILCLHGYAQNGQFFRSRTGGLRKAIKPAAEYVFLDAPYKATASFLGEIGDVGGDIRGEQLRHVPCLSLTAMATHRSLGPFLARLT